MFFISVIPSFGPIKHCKLMRICTCYFITYEQCSNSKLMFIELLHPFNICFQYMWELGLSLLSAAVWQFYLGLKSPLNAPFCWSGIQKTHLEMIYPYATKMSFWTFKSSLHWWTRIFNYCLSYHFLLLLFSCLTIVESETILWWLSKLSWLYFTQPYEPSSLPLSLSLPMELLQNE